MNKPAGIIGAGSFGLTVANLISKNSEVIIYTRNTEKSDKINQQKSTDYTISATNSLEHLTTNCQVIFPIIPSSAFASLLDNISPYVNPAHIFIHGTKGFHFPELESINNSTTTIDKNQIKTMSQLIQSKTCVVRVGCLAGPNLSKEIMDGQPAATVVSSEFQEVIDIGSNLLKSESMYTFGSKHLIGTELIGAFKNMIAIAAGMIEGLGLGKNVFGFLIARSIPELVQLCKCFGANIRPILGTAGVGDLVATASSKDSRNFSVGIKFGKGLSLKEIMETQTELAEGLRTIKAAYLLCKSYQLKAPITRLLYQIIYEEFPLDKAVKFIMSYPSEEDVDFL